MNSLLKCDSILLPFLLVLILFPSLSLCLASGGNHQDFLDCLKENSTSVPPELIYTPSNFAYSYILQDTKRNFRFNTCGTPKPLVIITPSNASHVQATIACSRKHKLQVRIRSGGHDYEGLSYLSPIPFVIIDLNNLRKITIDVISKTVWIQSGATLGELYHKIAEKSTTLAFPAGICPTVGVGGHFSGGGYGMLLRKHGLAADNIIDAQLVDVNGKILHRASMGEDLFWAIRGGGGNTFGVVIAWKLRLVPVPPTVTVFSVPRTLEQNASRLLYQWQYVATKLPADLMTQVVAGRYSALKAHGTVTVTAIFNALFLGGVDGLLPLMQESFPELGLVREDCHEMSWIEAQVSFATSFSGNMSMGVLLDRAPSSGRNFKGKSDYVIEPIPEKSVEGLLERMNEDEGSYVLFIPYGGKMHEISESSLPLPHRAVLYKIGYHVTWDESPQRHISWIRSLYDFMTPYVSENPRVAYINYRDLDIGTNNVEDRFPSIEKARIWGVKYFGKNFDRLVHVKTKVDPDNFFRNEQSIPPLSSWELSIVTGDNLIPSE